MTTADHRPRTWTITASTPLAPGITAVIGDGVERREWAAVCVLHQAADDGERRVVLGLLNPCTGEIEAAEVPADHPADTDLQVRGVRLARRWMPLRQVDGQRAEWRRQDNNDQEEN